MRTFVAFLAAPLGTIPAIVCCMLVGWTLGFGELRTTNFLELIGVSLFFSAYAVIVAYLVMATLGWIAVWLSRVYRWRSAKHYALLGVAVGTLPFILFFGYGLIADGFGPNGFEWNRVWEVIVDAFLIGVAYTVMGGVSGLFSALLFWKLAMRDRHAATRT